MRRQKVESREYKVMLRRRRFSGDEAQLLGAANEFWGEFAREIAAVTVRTDGEFRNAGKRRLVAFRDTSGQHLNAGGYILRERHDLDDQCREVTLKFRHPDRHVAQARDMSPSRRKGARTKFEEDIKVPFVSLYSFSTTVPVKEKRVLNRMGAVKKLFPGLADRLDGLPETAALKVVNGFTARELVMNGASIQIARKPKVLAECALIAWYDHDRDDHDPVAVEFSYRYGNAAERYGGAAARRAFAVFAVLQDKMRKWVDPNSRTKTAFVYN